jgi:hypothetical protein
MFAAHARTIGGTRVCRVFVSKHPTGVVAHDRCVPRTAEFLLSGRYGELPKTAAHAGSVARVVAVPVLAYIDERPWSVPRDHDTRSVLWNLDCVRVRTTSGRLRQNGRADYRDDQEVRQETAVGVIHRFLRSSDLDRGMTRMTIEPRSPPELAFIATIRALSVNGTRNENCAVRSPSARQKLGMWGLETTTSKCSALRL